MPADETHPRDTVRAHRHLRRYVLPGEKVVIATRRHWAQILEPIATAAGVFLVVAAIVMSTDAEYRGVVQWLWLVWLVVLGRLVWRWLEWYQEWFVATDKRLLLLYGLLVHRVAMMPLKKVTDMGYSRSPTGQLVGYGRLDMESAGQDQALRTVNYVPNPDATYRALCATIFTPGSGHDVDDDDIGPDKPSSPPVPPSFPPTGGGTGGTEPRPITQPIAVAAVASASPEPSSTPQRPAHEAMPFPEPHSHQDRWTSRLKDRMPRKSARPPYGPPQSDGAKPPKPFL